MPAVANETILFPDVVAGVLSHIRTQIPGTFTAAVIPKQRQSSMVIAYRTGGDSTLVVDLAQITVDSWADTGIDAHDLAQLVRAHIHALRGTTVAGVQFYGVNEISGPAWLPDSTSGQPRYRQTFQIGARGNPI